MVSRIQPVLRLRVRAQTHLFDGRLGAAQHLVRHEDPKRELSVPPRPRFRLAEEQRYAPPPRRTPYLCPCTPRVYQPTGRWHRSLRSNGPMAKKEFAYWGLPPLFCSRNAPIDAGNRATEIMLTARCVPGRTASHFGCLTTRRLAGMECGRSVRKAV